MPDSPPRKKFSGYVVAHKNGQVEFRCFARSYSRCRAEFCTLRANIGQRRPWEKWEAEGFAIVEADINVLMPEES